ncbi:MAG TPA: M20/M25/M40 family metallo-hydrolase [Bacteroidota bacterium]|nr:M20/M25/M40 family metallo-hydrolase [Bacteroidota bacterium]
MKKLVMVGSILLLFSISFGQMQEEKIDTTALAKIKDEGMNHSQVMETLSYLSDVYGPRLAWSPEYKQAAEWAASELKKWGLQNVHFENTSPVGRGWTVKNFSAQAVAPRVFPLIAYPKAWSPGLKGAVRGEAVYLNAKTEADLEKYKGKLKGAFVLISQPMPLKAHFTPDGQRTADSTLLQLADAAPPMPGQRPRAPFDTAMVNRFLATMRFTAKKADFCEQEGAVALIDVSRGDFGTVFVQSATIPRSVNSIQDLFGPRMAAYSPDAPKILPQVTVASENYNRLVRMIEKGQSVKLQMSLDVEFTKADSGFDIIGEIPGSDLKNEVVQVGGHFDSWHGGTGATDDGAGSAASMEAVRILKATGLQPRRTIRVSLWEAEEEGLLGSASYVAKHFGERKGGDRLAMMMGMGGSGTLNTLPEYDNFDVYFNHDNGTGKIRGVYLQGNEAARPIFRAWFAAFGDPTAQTITINNTGGTDHLSFDAIGLPGFQFIQDPIEYDTRTHHSNMDVFDRVQEDDMKQASTIMAFFLYQAANRDGKFPHKPMPGM